MMYAAKHNALPVCSIGGGGHVRGAHRPVRPHSSLKDLTPIEFKTRYDAVNQGAVL